MSAAKHSSLKDMAPDLFRQVVDLEAEKTIPLLQAVGLFVDRDLLEKDLLKNPEQTVIAVTEQGKLGAFFRFTRHPDAIWLRSVQVRKNAGLRIWRRLAREARDLLEREGGGRIRSVVQHSNPFGMRLHERLGFERVKENEHAVQYAVDIDVLLQTLGALFRLHR